MFVEIPNLLKYSTHAKYLYSSHMEILMSRLEAILRGLSTVIAEYCGINTEKDSEYISGLLTKPHLELITTLHDLIDSLNEKTRVSLLKYLVFEIEYLLPLVRRKLANINHGLGQPAELWTEVESSDLSKRLEFLMTTLQQIFTLSSSEIHCVAIEQNEWLIYGLKTRKLSHSRAAEHLKKHLFPLLTLSAKPKYWTATQITLCARTSIQEHSNALMNPLLQEASNQIKNTCDRLIDDQKNFQDTIQENKLLIDSLSQDLNLSKQNSTLLNNKIFILTLELEKKDQAYERLSKEMEDKAQSNQTLSKECYDLQLNLTHLTNTYQTLLENVKKKEQTYVDSSKEYKLLFSTYQILSAEHKTLQEDHKTLKENHKTLNEEYKKHTLEKDQINNLLQTLRQASIEKHQVFEKFLVEFEQLKQAHAAEKKVNIALEQKYTREREEHATSEKVIDNLTKDLAAKTLASEALSIEQLSLNKAYEELKQGHQFLKQNHEDLKTAHDALKIGHDALMLERDHLMQEATLVRKSSIEDQSLRISDQQKLPDCKKNHNTLQSDKKPTYNTCGTKTQTEGSLDIERTQINPDANPKKNLKFYSSLLGFLFPYSTLTSSRQKPSSDATLRPS